VSVEESELDFCDGELSARRLHDKVRGFAGWPGTKATFAVRKETEDAADAKDVSLKIVTTRVGDDDDDDDDGDAAARAAGTVAIRKECLRVPCAGGGWLEITELQPPGKKAMSARDYVNGLKGSVVAVKKTTTS
jgi:methionyl-tRNA formyltransferase